MMVDFQLPMSPVEVTSYNPRRLVLFAHTKTGKTEALAALPSCLIVDTEQGSEFVKALKIDFIKFCRENKLNPLDGMKLIGQKIQEANEKAGKPVYDYIAIDTTSGLQEFARWLATVMYKNTPIGKNFAGKDVISELPQGGGYEWLRQAFDELLKPIEKLAGKCFILVSHVKNSSINKNGKDLQAKDLDLTGKLKQIVCAEADAIGYLFRNPTNANQTMISFKTHEQDLATGARPPHLSNQEFVLLELTNPDYIDKKEPKVFKNNWDKIFI